MAPIIPNPGGYAQRAMVLIERHGWRLRLAMGGNRLETGRKLCLYSMEQHHKKRFIAGAICPQCRQQDSLVLLIGSEQESVNCVNCGFSLSQADSQPADSDGQLIGMFKP